MSKNVTIHDVAREAGVSSATVSYIINNRSDQSISEETKQKVWHVINMLNYKPSIFAKNLRSAPESKLIAVCTDSTSELNRAEFFNILNALSEAIDSNYSLVYSRDPYKRFTNTDVIIAYNVSKQAFYDIGKSNFIPLIAIDSLIEDKLFFQVNTNLETLKSDAYNHFKGEYFYVSITPSDLSLKAKIEHTFAHTRFVEDYKDLLNIKDANVLTTNAVIAEMLSANGANVLYPSSLYDKKCKQIAECITQALSHEQFDVHFYEV